jgi:hypothetical protein
MQTLPYLHTLSNTPPYNETASSVSVTFRDSVTVFILTRKNLVIRATDEKNSITAVSKNRQQEKGAQCYCFFLLPLNQVAVARRRKKVDLVLCTRFFEQLFNGFHHSLL